MQSVGRRSRPTPKLEGLVSFEAFTLNSDGLGGQEKVWQEVFQARAEFTYLRGGEAVQSARLSGTQPVVVTIRRHAQADAVDHTWRMRDMHNGGLFNVRAKEPNRERPRQFWDLMCERGVAT